MAGCKVADQQDRSPNKIDLLRTFTWLVYLFNGFLTRVIKYFPDNGMKQCIKLQILKMKELYIYKVMTLCKDLTITTQAKPFVKRQINFQSLDKFPFMVYGM